MYQTQMWAATQAKARDEPNRRPFRLYFGLAYLGIGATLLLYMVR